jgi:phosphoribosylformylglycinamidine cyclo-ligase
MAFLQAQGTIEPEEMARTFNCGVGMVLAVSEANVADVTARLEAAGETVVTVGRIEAGDKGCTVRGRIETWSAKADWSATHLG